MVVWPAGSDLLTAVNSVDGVSEDVLIVLTINIINNQVLIAVYT